MLRQRFARVLRKLHRFPHRWDGHVRTVTVGIESKLGFIIDLDHGTGLVKLS